jgi:uncharacterized protein (TIGR03435 family)
MKPVTLRFLALCFFLVGCQKSARFQDVTIQIHEPNPYDQLKPALHFNHFVAQDQTLLDLIAFAYQVEPAQLVGGDDLRENSFNVFAEVPSSTTEGPLPAMVRDLLEQRFKLVAHRESRSQDFFALGVAPGGPKFKPAADDAAEPNTPADFRYTIPLRNTMSQWAQVLSQIVKRPVMDRTGLQGKYSANLGLNLDTDAIEETLLQVPAQLGLTLDPRREKMDMVVIDKAEPLPTEK